MGVKGLTSYIARKAELYLQPYELHDCDLVVDGDSLACNLYRSIPDSNSAFGGDYDHYYRTVVHFFNILSKCNIRSFVLMDGGYELKKMKTTEKRLRSRIIAIKFLNPANNSDHVFPLMMREVFIEAVKDCENAKIMRCFFEADEEIAILSRKLNCPVLSYDSDFYIHNVMYIPLVTLTLKVLEKKEEISTAAESKTKNLSYTRARNLKKRFTMGKKQLGKEMSNGSDIVKPNKPRTIRYLDCCLYKIENLTSNRKIRPDVLPLFAALLGNDYISSSIFSQFYTQITLKGIGKRMSKQQKRIRAILNWLQHETKESATLKVLLRMKKEERSRLLAQIKCASDGYNREKSDAFEYFGLKEEDFVKNVKKCNEKFAEVLDLLSGESDEDEDDEEEELTDSCSSCDASSDENADSSCENKEETDCIHDEKLGKEKEIIISEIDLIEEEEESDDSELDEMFSWFREKILSAELPRFFVDLFHLRLYINYPQIENFMLEDCNQIAVPILTHIFGLMTYPESEDLRYLTRTVRVTNVCYKTLKAAPPYPFDPFKTDKNAIKVIFQINEFPFVEKLFEEVEKLPSHLKLYFLAIIYWITKSKYVDVLHLYSLIICCVILNTIDEKFAEVRNPNEFQKKFGKYISNFKKTKDSKTNSSTDNTNNGTETKTLQISKVEATIKKAEELMKNLSLEEKIKYIPKITFALLQERLLKFLNVSENFHKTHNDFSSTILHGFSEFQSVIFFMNSLNTFVNKPFESAKISKLYCGILLYNLYTNLKSRQDIEYHIKNYIFKDCNILFDYFKFLLEWCKNFVPYFDGKLIATKNKKSKNKQTKKSKKEKPERQQNNIENMADMIENNNSDSHELNDLNNKFCTLLKCK